MEFLERMRQVVDYIETHLDGEIEARVLSRIVCCSAVQFGRVFAYVVGVPLSEYIRRRRLSLAALALRDGEKVVDAALRYGYASPDAFGRAFSALHGITPREAARRDAVLTLYPRITFHINIKGDAKMEYRIVEQPDVHCVGVVKNLGQWKPNETADTWEARSGDLWRVWDVFLDHGMNEVIRDRYALYRPPLYQVGMNWTMPNGETVVSIGAQARAGETYPELTPFVIPAATWVVFDAVGTLNQQVHPVTAVMARIQQEWLPSSGYVQAMPCELEVYGPGNTQQADYRTEIWVPVGRA